MGREKLALLFAVTVDVIWSVVALEAIFLSHDYAALTIVTPVMLVATGFVFGFKADLRRNRGNNGKENSR